ncbi:MAG: hypothetical protein JRG91_18000 [Deltaproteobacteria bacterium]|nr:hypothetical protein [Deltaproteobacteria bacterium]
MSRCTLLMVILAIQLGACGSTVKAGNPDSTTTDAVDDGAVDTATEPGDDPAAEVADDAADDPVVDRVVDTTPTDGVLGDPCAGAGDCTGVPGEGRFCATEIPMGPGGTVTFPGGYCSAGCNSDGGCGDGGYCLMDPMGGEGMCFKLCSSGADCRTSEGYSCTSIPSPYPPPDMCMPPMW